MKTIGLIGLGNMGFPIAQRVTHSTFNTIVYDLREDPCKILREQGARVASSTTELAMQSDLICLVVNNDAQLKDVLVGPSGLLRATRSGTIIAIHSTVSPQICRELAGSASERGVTLIDAPVSGSEFGARDGTLTLMVGGPAGALEACRAVFETYAAKIFHLGEVGAGQIAKLANNLMVGVNTYAVFEGLRLAGAAGIEHAKMLEVAQASSGDSFALRKYDYFIDMADRYLGGLAAFQDTVAKDLRHAVRLAEEYGFALPVTSATLENYRNLWTRDS